MLALSATGRRVIVYFTAGRAKCAILVARWLPGRQGREDATLTRVTARARALAAPGEGAEPPSRVPRGALLHQVSVSYAAAGDAENIYARRRRFGFWSWSDRGGGVDIGRL